MIAPLNPPPETVYAFACVDPASIPTHYATGLGDVVGFGLSVSLLLVILAVGWYAWRLRVAVRSVGEKVVSRALASDDNHVRFARTGQQAALPRFPRLFAANAMARVWQQLKAGCFNRLATFFAIARLRQFYAAFRSASE